MKGFIVVLIILLGILTYHVLKCSKEIDRLSTLNSRLLEKIPADVLKGFTIDDVR